MRFLLLLLLCFVFLGSKAFACRGPTEETQTYLTTLPDNANAHNIIAEVKIISTYIDSSRRVRISVVDVVSPVKGVQAEQRFNVISGLYDCDRDRDVEEGDQYYIAGAMDGEGYFRGVWKGLPFEYFRTRQPND